MNRKAMKRIIPALIMFIFTPLLFASAEIDLFTALLNQNWQTAEKILDRYPRLLDKQGEEEFDASLGNMTLDSLGRTPLTFVLENGMDYQAVQLLDYGADTEARDRDGWTPLMVASYGGNVKMVRLLLERGARVEVFNGEGLSPLALAVGACRFAAADLLLEWGADLYGDIPGALPIVQDIYKSKIDLREALNILDKGAPAYPLFDGIETGEYSRVRMMLLQGMNPDSPDSQGVTPLMVASSLETPYMTELLVDQGADPDLRDRTGLTPLAVALYNGRERNALILMDGGADLNGGRMLDETPLYYGLIGGSSLLVAELISRGCTVTRRDGEGRTALMYAAFLGDWLSVRSLLEGGARATALDGEDRGVVYYAMMGYLMTGGDNYYSIVDRLIGEGAESRGYLSLAGGDRKFYELLEARWR